MVTATTKLEAKHQVGPKNQATSFRPQLGRLRVLTLRPRGTAVKPAGMEELCVLSGAKAWVPMPSPARLSVTQRLYHAQAGGGEGGRSRRMELLPFLGGG